MITTLNGQPLQINDTVTLDGVDYIVQDMDGATITVIEKGAATKRTKRFNAATLGMYVEDAAQTKARAVLAKRKLRSYWED